MLNNSRFKMNIDVFFSYGYRQYKYASFRIYVYPYKELLHYYRCERINI